MERAYWVYSVECEDEDEKFLFAFHTVADSEEDAIKQVKGFLKVLLLEEEDQQKFVHTESIKKVKGYFVEAIELTEMVRFIS